MLNAVHYNCSGPDHTVRANADIIHHADADCNPGSLPDCHGAAQMRPDGNMNEISYRTVMVNRTAGIDNHTPAKFCSRIDDRACHNRRAFPDGHIICNNRARMNENRETASAKTIHELFPNRCISNAYEDVSAAARCQFRSANHRPFSTFQDALVVIIKFDLAVAILFSEIGNDLSVSGSSDNCQLHSFTALPLNGSIVADVSEWMPSRFSTVLMVAKMILQSPRKVM